MEDVEEFKKWLRQMLKDSKKLNMTNETIAYVLLQEGLDYYLKTIVRKY